MTLLSRLKKAVCGEPAKAVAPATPRTPAPRPFPDPDTTGWPDIPPGSAEAATARFQGQVNARLKRIEAEVAKTAARYNADLTDLGRFSTAYTTMASGSIDRARAGADAAQKASAAIAALYTGVLGLTFSVTDNPLPPRGIVPAIFLGAAVVFSTAYLAYLRAGEQTVKAPSGTATRTVEANVLSRVGVLVEAARTISSRNAWCLRAAVLSLGVGLAFLPLPFLTLSGGAVTAATPPDWPEPTVASGEELELVKLRYAAEVEETSSERQSTVTTDESTEWWLIGGCMLGGGLIIAVGTAVPAAITHRRRKKQRERATAGTPATHYAPHQG